MFLHVEQPDSSQESSDGDASRTNEETLLRKVKSDKHVFARKSRCFDGEILIQVEKECSFRDRKPEEPPRRSSRADTQMSAIEVIESLLVEGPRTTNDNASNHKFDGGQVPDSASLVSKSCIESLRDSLIGQTKRRKELEFSLELKDRMIAELQLQNDLYEKLNSRPRLSNLQPIPERQSASSGLQPKKIHKKSHADILERKPTEKAHDKTLKHSTRDRKESKEADFQPKKTELAVRHHQQAENQNLRYRKLIKNFGETLSKLARKQVARDGKQSKDLRELWDVWNRLVKDLS